MNMATAGTATQPAGDRLNIIKTTIECGRIELARAEANLENLKKQQTGIEGELADLGVTPEDLDATITTLRAEVDRLLGEAETLLAEPPKEEEAKTGDGTADKHAA